MKARDYSWIDTSPTYRRTLAELRNGARIVRVHRCGRRRTWARQGHPCYVHTILLLVDAGKLVEVEHGGPIGQPGEFWTYRLAVPSALDWEI